MTKRRITLVAVLFSFIFQCFPVTVFAAVNNDAEQGFWQFIKESKPYQLTNAIYAKNISPLVNHGSISFNKLCNIGNAALYSGVNYVKQIKQKNVQPKESTGRINLKALDDGVFSLLASPLKIKQNVLTGNNTAVNNTINNTVNNTAVNITVNSTIVPETAKPMEAILSAKVMDISGSSILLSNMAEDADRADIYRLNGDKLDNITDADGKKLDISALKRGMLVNIAFDGIVQDSFPMGISSPTGIVIKSQSDDIGGLYQTVIDDLYHTDSSLNHNAQILAFNLNGVVNMKETEKTALIYLVGNTYKKPAIAGTYEELCQQGYINKELLLFENGLLFTITDTNMTNGHFTFDADKWRSGEGAIIFKKNTAKKTKDGWKYTIGEEWIS
jgi:hypothetical protein